MSKKRTKEEAVARATDIVLSCRRCKNPTDQLFNDSRKVWISACECGKTSEYDEEFIKSEIEQISKEYYED